MKISNFKIDKLIQLDSIFQNRPDLMQGPHGYQAPEKNKMLSNNKKIDENKADVFSLGLTILQIITQESILEISSDPNQINSKISEIPYEWAKELLTKMLAFDYKIRYNFSKLLKFIDIIEQTSENFNN